MKYFILVGEPSGDLHGSNLVKEIRKQDPNAEICGFGGDMMKANGVKIICDLDSLSFMGFYEVILNLKTIKDNFKKAKKWISEWNPDALICIDYPGFNLRMAKWARDKVPYIHYYISPQIWAWKEKRIYKMDRYTDRISVILPFEVDFYKKYGFTVDYVGHPLIEVIEDYQYTDLRKKYKIPSEDKIIALLPGSRTQEISTILPVMFEVATKYPQCHFMLAEAPNSSSDLYDQIASKIPNLPKIIRIKDETYSVLKQADAALVTSGTATLETALHKTPQIVCYKGSPISFWLAKKLIKVKYISLVNLIVDSPLVTELIQADCNAKKVSEELGKILDPINSEDIILKYEELWHKLGTRKASKTVARNINVDLT